MQLNFDSKSLVFHKLAVIEFNLMLQGMERRRGAEEQRNRGEHNDCQ